MSLQPIYKTYTEIFDDFKACLIPFSQLGRLYHVIRESKFPFHDSTPLKLVIMLMGLWLNIFTIQSEPKFPGTDFGSFSGVFLKNVHILKAITTPHIFREQKQLSVFSLLSKNLQRLVALIGGRTGENNSKRRP